MTVGHGAAFFPEFLPTQRLFAWTPQSFAISAAAAPANCEGLRPIALVLTYGSTNTSGTDDIAAFKDFAKAGFDVLKRFLLGGKKPGVLK